MEVYKTYGEQKANMIICRHANSILPRNDPRHVCDARRGSDGGYEMAGKRRRISAQDQRSSPDSFDIGDADVASELVREIEQAGSS